MTGTTSVYRTNIQDIDGVAWITKWDTPDLTYSFPTDASYYGISYGPEGPNNNFEPFNSIQISAVRNIVSAISSATNLGFTEITETATTHATLRFAMSDTPFGAWAYLPNITEAGGDLWYNNSNGSYDRPTPGNYAYYAIMHEVGHSLGIVTRTLCRASAITTAHDLMEYSVMTYRSYVGADGAFVYNEPSGYAQTPMMYDIAALQHMYGADFSTNSGDTTYRWDSDRPSFY